MSIFFALLRLDVTEQFDHVFWLRSWLQDTLKRKLVDFAWNRRFYYLPGACLPFFGLTRLKVLINPIVFILSACFDQSSGQLRVNPGKQEGGGVKKIKKSACFLFEVSCSQRRSTRGANTNSDACIETG